MIYHSFIYNSIIFLEERKHKYFEKEIEKTKSNFGTTNLNK